MLQVALAGWVQHGYISRHDAGVVRHGVIQCYEMHFKGATSNVHLLPNQSCRPFVASLWYLLTKLFSWSIGFTQLKEWSDKWRSSLPEHKSFHHNYMLWWRRFTLKSTLLVCS